jgi:hypothetical protein
MILDPSQIQEIQRRRLIAWLFERLNVRVKEPCLKCGTPFLVESPRYNPDRSSLCPRCKPRTGGEVNAASYCDCGKTAAVVVYLASYHPENPHPTYQPTPLCETCAIDELLARIKGQI